MPPNSGGRASGTCIRSGMFSCANATCSRRSERKHGEWVSKIPRRSLLRLWIEWSVVVLTSCVYFLLTRQSCVQCRKSMARLKFVLNERRLQYEKLSQEGVMPQEELLKVPEPPKPVRHMTRRARTAARRKA